MGIITLPAKWRNMAETSVLTESMAESRVNKVVRGAIENVQQGNQEYWEIRQTIQDRLKWHGGGVYKAHVQRMEQVTNALYGGKDAKFWDKVKRTGINFEAKVEGRMLQVASASADFVWNFLRWFPLGIPGKILPIPKDIFKRMALGVSTARVTSLGAGLMVAKGWERGVENVRNTASAVITAREVGKTMLKRRVDHFVDQIKNPNPMKSFESKPNKPFKVR